MSDKILQYTDRRNFMKALISAPALDTEIKSREKTNTIPLQIELLKAFYKLSRKLKCEYTVTVPYIYRIENDWYSTKTIPILNMFDNGLILLHIEEMGFIESEHKWITGNTIRFDNPDIPELINFNGIKTPFFELFRLGLVKHQVTFEDCEVDICQPLLPIPMLPR